MDRRCAPEEQGAFIARAERNARAALLEMDQHVPDDAARDQRALGAAHLGARMDVEARVSWLGKLRDIFDLPK